VNKTLDQMDMQLELPVMPSPFGLDLVPQFATVEGRGPRCKLMCNGKPAWFKGQFPCLGKLKLVCESGEDSPKFAPNFVAASCKGFWTGIFGHKVSHSLAW
jgi:hypothetical protein